MSFSFSKQQFDIVVIGSGGAGLMAAISAVNSGAKNIAVVSKVNPNYSHTSSAKGGINAALGNVTKDDWKWHAYDTIKGSDYLADVDAVEVLCENAKEAVLDLEKMGVVFSRQQDAKLSQRAYGGQTTSFGKGEIAYRACYSKDKTGQTILQTLYEQAIKNNVKFFSEFFVSDLFIKDKKTCHGCLAIDLNSGEIVIFESKIVILATGGYSQIYHNTTSSLICTGDGSALVLKEGLPVQDMEFIQFHPTGIHDLGFLITEAARGEGAHLLNNENERFMNKYAPKMMELASRDIISRSMALEIHEGKGCGKDKNFINLDLRHLSDDILNHKLPGVVELVQKFCNLDVKHDLIPVSPSAHYTMGGVPTNVKTSVTDEKNQEITGLMAIGEAASVSVHGANRLGCNSLLDLVVFGKIAGLEASRRIKNISFLTDIKNLILSKISKLSEKFDCNVSNIDSLSEIKSSLQQNNERYLGVFREENSLDKGLKANLELFARFRKYKIKNRSLLWNEDLIAYLELENLFLNSIATNFSAIERKESRGAHYRFDFKNRSDDQFLAHSLVKITDIKENRLEFSLKAVRIDSSHQELQLIPKPREY